MGPSKTAKQLTKRKEGTDAGAPIEDLFFSNESMTAE